MTKRIHHIVSLIVLSCVFQFSFSQSVYVKASIDRDKILIGEPIHLRLEASFPEGSNPQWFKVDSIPHFDFIDKAKIDTVNTNSGFTYHQVLTITSFDSGRWVIPTVSLELNGRSYLTDSLPVSVAFSNFDASQDYHDIKDILTVENPSFNYINWIIAAITLLSLIGVIYFLRKKVQRAEKPILTIDSKLSPFEEAMASLRELQRKMLPENDQVKAYYTGLNDILRMFIARKLSLRTMQKTSEELLLQIRDLGLPNDDFIAVAQTLKMSDAVKFAKYVPGKEYNDESFKIVQTSIERLNNLKA